MDSIQRVAVALLALLVPSLAAAFDCSGVPFWQAGAYTGSSPAEACDPIKGDLQSTYNSTNTTPATYYFTVENPVTDVDGDIVQYTCQMKRIRNNQTTNQGGYTVTKQCGPDPCAAQLGDTVTLMSQLPPGGGLGTMCKSSCVWQERVNNNGDVPVGGCFGDSCVTFDGITTYFRDFENLGTSCPDPNTLPDANSWDSVPETPAEEGDPYQPNDEVICEAVNDEIYCSILATNCGTVNGELVCLDSVPPGDCVILSGGSHICDAGGTSQSQGGNLPDVVADGLLVTGEDIDGDLVEGDLALYFSGDVINGAAPEDGGVNPDGSLVDPDQNGEPGDQGANCDPQVEECGTGTGSVSGGATCDSPPVCEGDPILCGLIDQEWLQRCPDVPTETELLATAGLEDYGVGGSEDPFDKGEVDLTTALDDSGWGLTRSCPADLSVSLLGGSVTVPVTVMCTTFQLIGTLLLVAGFLGAARIFVGGF